VTRTHKSTLLFIVKGMLLKINFVFRRWLHSKQWCLEEKSDICLNITSSLRCVDQMGFSTHYFKAVSGDFNQLVMHNLKGSVRYPLEKCILTYTST